MPKTAYLAVDIAPQVIRAWCFDNENGCYCLREKVFKSYTPADGSQLLDQIYAIFRELENKTEIKILDENQRLCFDEHQEKTPLRGLGLSTSAGKPIRTALVGVSDAFSMAALRRLITMFYGEVALEINLQDDLNATEQLKKMISTDIDLFVIAGGVNEGAYNTVKTAIENIRLVYHLVPKTIKPQIVFAGNRELAEYARLEIDASQDFHTAENILADIESEDLQLAWKALLNAFQRVRFQQNPALKELCEQGRTSLLPTIFSIGRITRFLDQSRSQEKGVIVLNAGANEIEIVASQNKKLYGISQPLRINDEIITDTQYFDSQDLEASATATYLQNRILFPDCLPATLDDLSIEQSLNRVRIKQGLEKLRSLYPNFGYSSRMGLWEPIDQVILTGSEFSEKLLPHQVFMVALDGLLVQGIANFVLDKNQVLPALGSLAEIEPLLAVQLMDSEEFVNLGTVIGVISRDGNGSKVLEIEVNEGGDTPRWHARVLKSEIKRIEILPNTRTQLYLSPSVQSDIGMGSVGLGGWLTVSDAQVGVVIDARGRPMRLPENGKARSQLIRDWLWELGG